MHVNPVKSCKKSHFIQTRDFSHRIGFGSRPVAARCSANKQHSGTQKSAAFDLENLPLRREPYRATGDPLSSLNFEKSLVYKFFMKPIFGFHGSYVAIKYVDYIEEATRLLSLFRPKLARFAGKTASHNAP